MSKQAEKSISELLSEIGVSHRRSRISNLHVLTTETSTGPVAIDELDAYDASHFYACAQSAA